MCCCCCCKCCVFGCNLGFLLSIKGILILLEMFLDFVTAILSYDAHSLFEYNYGEEYIATPERAVLYMLVALICLLGSAVSLILHIIINNCVLNDALNISAKIFSFCAALATLIATGVYIWMLVDMRKKYELLFVQMCASATLSLINVGLYWTLSQRKMANLDKISGLLAATLINLIVVGQLQLPKWILIIVYGLALVVVIVSGVLFVRYANRDSVNKFVNLFFAFSCQVYPVVQGYKFMEVESCKCQDHTKESHEAKVSVDSDETCPDATILLLSKTSKEDKKDVGEAGDIVQSRHLKLRRQVATQTVRTCIIRAKSADTVM